MEKQTDWFMVGVYTIGITLITLIIVVCGLYMKVSDLTRENGLLVAQKETLSGVVTNIDCDKRLMRLGLPANLHDVMRFKYDPNTGSIYDNDTKEIYRKVEKTVTIEVPDGWLDSVPDKPIHLDPVTEMDMKPTVSSPSSN